MHPLPMIDCRITFLTPEEGGRKHGFPRDGLSGDQYRPHLVAGDPMQRVPVVAEGNRIIEEYLGVSFTEGPEVVEAGRPLEVRLKLIYAPHPGYEELVPGATFTIREGGHIVGYGSVIREVRVIRRAEITEILHRWRNGDLTAREVHEWADRTWIPGDSEYEDWEGDNGEEVSVTNEVMAALDSLDMNLVLPEDIPIYLEFLETPLESFPEGYKRYRAALDAIDYRERRKRLRHDPLYAPFCN